MLLLKLLENALCVEAALLVIKSFLKSLFEETVAVTLLEKILDENDSFSLRAPRDAFLEALYLTS
jgi:hypothetical protein